MKKYILLFISAFLLIGCSNDDFNNETPYNATDIIGEWIFYEDVNKSYITNITLHENSTVETYIYRYPSISTVWQNAGSGVWTYSRSTRNLEMSVSYVSDLQIKSNNYTVENVDAYSLNIYDKQLHSHDTYIRVAKSCDLFMDDKQDIKDLLSSFYANEYESLNANIASVNSEGIITTNGIGTTFIIAKSGDQKMAVRVNVKNGISRHSSEINTNISSVIKKYGTEYYYRGQEEIGYGLSIIAYTNPESEPCAQEVQYHYEPYSGSIVCIEILYRTPKSLQNDIDYLYLSHNYLNLPPNTLFVAPKYLDVLDSEYYIMPLTNGLRYGSTNFLNTYHYANAWGYTIPGLFDN